ncbi:hypothetical protein FSP39_015116 [Pinctada imbricata]|uniref:EF-hand domain-containing protein n=1 Tax=Pinctada imbricata TaxID=66713 RepID=A0AA88YEE4_PINIB|nr:hypothetical protein FSP39_015116 [Pinctada imbricata]
MNVKLMLLMCMLVTAVTGGWWGRRRRHRTPSPSKPGTVSGSVDCAGRGRCSGTVSVEKTWNHDRTSLGGHISCQFGGGCGGGFVFRHRFKRQAVNNTNKFVISLSLPQCNFESYDLNENDEIEKEELEMWFDEDDQVLIESLLYSLDIDGDEVVSIQEFNEKAPTEIEGCDDQVDTNDKITRWVKKMSITGTPCRCLHRLEWTL